MRLIKLLVLFALAFLAAWAMIFTFSQEPFRQAVPAKLLFYQTQAIPIYIYLFAAFCGGLGVGLGFAVFAWFTMAAKLREARRESDGMSLPPTVPPAAIGPTDTGRAARE